MSVTNSTTSAVREQLRGLRERLAQQRRQVAMLREEFAEDPTREASSRLAQSVNGRDELQQQIERLQEQEKEMLGQIDHHANGAEAVGSVGEQLADPAFAAELAKYAHTSARMGDVTLGEVDRSMLVGWTGKSLAQTGVITPTSGMTQTAMQRIVPLPTAPPSFLDLVASRLPSIFRAFRSCRRCRRPAPGPAPTAPMALKPAVSFEYQDAEATPATIAGYVKIARQTLADVPMLSAIVERRLMTTRRCWSSRGRFCRATAA